MGLFHYYYIPRVYSSILDHCGLLLLLTLRQERSVWCYCVISAVNPVFSCFAKVHCSLVKFPWLLMCWNNFLRRIVRGLFALLSQKGKLASLLLEMFYHLLDLGALTKTLTEDNIIHLLKPGKNAADCGSHSPVSLLNWDIKILAKRVAIRLDTVLTHDSVRSDRLY